MQPDKRWLFAILVLAVIVIGVGLSKVFRGNRLSARRPIATTAASSAIEPPSAAAGDAHASASAISASASTDVVPCITVSMPVFTVSPGPPSAPSAYADSLPVRAHTVLVRTDVKCLGRGDRVAEELPDGSRAIVEVKDVAEKSRFVVELHDSPTQLDSTYEFWMPAGKIVYPIVPVGIALPGEFSVRHSIGDFDVTQTPSPFTTSSEGVAMGVSWQ